MDLCTQNINDDLLEGYFLGFFSILFWWPGMGGEDWGGGGLGVTDGISGPLMMI